MGYETVKPQALRPGTSRANSLATSLSGLGASNSNPELIVFKDRQTESIDLSGVEQVGRKKVRLNLSGT
tara:strand:- start:287 stop:493 length:207 start_codon:yes stop_codon:yes gene_type:complete